jgi:hypothetical protein
MAQNGPRFGLILTLAKVPIVVIAVIGCTPASRLILTAIA